MAAKTSGAKAGSANEIAFRQDTAECPVCKAPSNHLRIKLHLCHERDRDIDMRPKKFDWQMKGIAGLHPPLYYMWHCPSCHFCAPPQVFDDPAWDCKIPRGALGAALEKAAREDQAFAKTIALLVEDLDGEPDFERAVRTHLLAIRQLSTVKEAVATESMNLGKYCLRLGWLYRDIHQDAARRERCMPRLEALFKKLAPLWSQAPLNEEQALRQSVGYYTTALTQSRSLETARDEVELILHIARIMMKLGDAAEARKMLQTCKEKQRRFEEKNREDAREAEQKGRSLPDEARAQMSAEERRIRLQHDNVQNLFEDIWREYEDKQLSDGAKLVAANRGKSRESLQELLSSKGYDARMIAKLLPKEEKKKGLLGGIFG